MSALLAASLVDVLGSVVGVVAGLTGVSLVLMGACSAIEGTLGRGVIAIVIGAGLVLGGLYLTGFLG